MIGLASPELKVGALVVVVSGLIGFMSLKVTEGPGVFGGSKTHTFEVENAGGLVKNSAVKMAGIKVGIIRDIRLKNGVAEVEIIVDDEVPITTETKVELRADGILGDKHVEIVQGDPNAELLKDGKRIKSAKDIGSLDNVMQEVSKISTSLSELAKNLNNATQGAGDNSTPLGRIILNIENLTRDISEITGTNKDKVNDILDRVQNISKNLDHFIGDDTSDGFKAAWQKAIDSLSRIDTSLKNVEEITGKINRGEGTIGRLVNDEDTVDNINEAITNVSDLVGGANRLETSIDFHSEYLGDTEATKSYIGVKIQPGLDRFYELAIVDDSKGVVRTVESKDTVGDGPEVESKTVKNYRNKTKFTALFAKNFYDLTLKAGLLESYAGVGLDYHLINKRLRLSLETFDFDDLYVRAFAKYNIYRGIYVIGGGDNVLDNKSDDDRETSYFIGAGIFITNDDLKLFASKLSF